MPIQEELAKPKFQHESCKFGGIPAYVVEDHNDVFKYWYEYNLGTPAFLLHIDAHDDMRDKAKNKIPPHQNLNEFINGLNIADFIVAAAHYNLINAIGWLRFKENSDVFKVSHFGPLDTIEEDNTINWNYRGTRSRPTSTYMSNMDSIKELINRREGKVIWDIDLDTFLCVDDVELRKRDPKEQIAFAKQRVDILFEELEGVPPPGLITIARSSGVNEYTPNEHVDEIQDYLLSKLHDRFEDPLPPKED